MPARCPPGFDDFSSGRIRRVGEEMRQAAAAGTLDVKQRQAIFTKWGVHFDED